jgi:Family of unknown function (DUF6496)
LIIAVGTIIFYSIGHVIHIKNIHNMAKYSKAAQKSVATAMKQMEKGKLESGQSGKKVTDPKQAIAIGLSEAKKKGAKVPPKPGAKPTAKKSAGK